MAPPKKSSALYTVLAVMAALLVVGGLGLFWIAYRGMQMLKAEAVHAGSVMMGDASVLAGKPDWIGTWEGGGITMTIDANAHVDYAMKAPNESEKLNGSMSFDGSDLVIDVIVFKKKLRIDKPPHLDGTRTVMTLDGKELERK